MCDSATISYNYNKVNKSHCDDCDLGSTDSLTSDSRSNGKFTVFEHLRKKELKNMTRITTAQISINTLRNKFSLLYEATHGNINILLVIENKLDSSFPSVRFHIYEYTTPYRLDRNANGRGLLLYVREDIPSKKIHKVDFDINSQSSKYDNFIALGRIKAEPTEIAMSGKSIICFKNPNKPPCIDLI